MDAITPIGATTHDWMVNAAHAAAVATGLIDSTSGNYGWGTVVVGALAVLGVLRAALPGVYGAGANMLYNLVATFDQKQADQKNDHLANAAHILVATIENAPPTASKQDILNGLKNALIQFPEVAAVIQESRMSTLAGESTVTATPISPDKAK